MNKTFKHLLLIVCSVLTIVYVIYLKLSNIDMTQTRFAITYWKQILGSFAIMAGLNAWVKLGG